ncbi:MAG: Mini-ribonuclease 3 [Ignavibacteriales bacterium]
MESLSEFLSFNNIPKKNIQEMTPITLAYIGDAVFELFVRLYLIGEGDVKTSLLHKKSITFVKAQAQAEIVKAISDLLTEEERDIIRRGRNIKPASPPKNADIMDYRYATGFEALIGYLYLMEDNKRLLEILKLCIEAKGNKQQNIK